MDTVTARCTHPKPLSHSDRNSSRFTVFLQKNRQECTSIISAHPVDPSLHCRAWGQRSSREVAKRTRVRCLGRPATQDQQGQGRPPSTGQRATVDPCGAATSCRGVGPWWRSLLSAYRVARHGGGGEPSPQRQRLTSAHVATTGAVAAHDAAPVTRSTWACHVDR